MRKKSDLPEKVCPVCNRPFNWRKNGKRSGMRWFIVATSAEKIKAIIITNHDRNHGTRNLAFLYLDKDKNP
jgi:hypothetical protein